MYIIVTLFNFLKGLYSTASYFPESTNHTIFLLNWEK